MSLGKGRITLETTFPDGSRLEHHVEVDIMKALEHYGRFQGNMNLLKRHGRHTIQGCRTKVLSVEHIEGT